ncbi:MAG TPA: SurA N-terminal domain-containing protein [Dokdonella sp.]|uniref:SurA N-terminal domain-containing protein n=1 Tax=Dokdonella sp. TaxID=2291710 RepID=UPI002D7E6AEF|nr:SurA N-terminal domain-containing protein [Dokdonella sp.]HET9034319.1 SurA N-terminal domain-containing protein [Dokdonella sp.]
MLQALQKKTTGWPAMILLGLIVITFSFFGIESYFVSQTDSFVAKVGDKEISQQEFRSRFDEFRQQQLRASNGAIDARFFEQPAIKLRILDQLIDEQVLLTANANLGIAVPAQRLRDEISKIPEFQRDGKFDPALYRARLSAQGMTPNGFADRVAKQFATSEIPRAVATSAFVTDAEVDTYLRLRGQLRDIRYVKLSKREVADNKVSEEEISSFYKEHQKDYMNPEQVALSYIEIDGAKLDIQLNPDESTLKDRYEKEKSRFVSSEQRLASHILIKVGGKGAPEDQKKALEKAQKIADEAKAGKDFAELAKSSSDDLGSKALGGDLGWLDKGMTDPAFEEALYALDKGKVSDPVLSSEGYHVIEVRDIRPGSTRTFDEVRDELAKDYSESERERVFNDKSGRMIDLTYEDSTSLEPAAKELGLKIQTTPLFSRAGGTGIAANPEVIKAAFSDQVLVQGNNSDKIDLGPNQIAIVRVSEHKAATPKPIEEVRTDIQRAIIEARIGKQAKEHADALFARLKKGESIDSIAEELKLAVEEQRGLGRNAVKVDTALIKAAFALPRPSADNRQVELVALANDEYALLKLDNVADADPTAVDLPTREAARTTLQQATSNAAARDFVAALRASMDVQIAEDRM